MTDDTPRAQATAALHEAAPDAPYDLAAWMLGLDHLSSLDAPVTEGEATYILDRLTTRGASLVAHWRAARASPDTRTGEERLR